MSVQDCFSCARNNYINLHGLGLWFVIREIYNRLTEHLSCLLLFTDRELSYFSFILSPAFVPPTETPKLAGITRDPNDVELELMAEDDQAKYYEIEVFSPGTVSKIRVEVIDEPSTTVVIPYLDPETQYYVTINTANAFGKSDKITLTVEKISGGNY